MKRKVCKNCRAFYEGSACPNCKSTETVTSWQGRLAIIQPEKSQIAKKLGIKKKGEYAIKAR